MKKSIKKITTALCFSCAVCAAMGLVACGANSEKGKTEFSRTLPTEVVCGSEIYFKEYLPIDFEAEYELSVSYFDCERLEQVNDEELDSLMFKFNDVSQYDFKLNRVGTEPISFSIKSVPVQPKLMETADWQTDKDETVLIEDLVFWCNITLKDDAAKIDPTYQLSFVDVEVRSIYVDGSATKEDLSGATSYTFEEEAEYVFTVKASNTSGEDTATVKVATMDLKNHAAEICGYVLDEKDTIEFDVKQFSSFQLPADGEALKVRVGNEKYDAVYSASAKAFTVSNFTQNIAAGEDDRLYIADKAGVAYSVNVMVPDLVVTKDNFKKLETVKDGTIILAEDIDMKEISNYGESRTGSYMDYEFKGVFDGRGHTIRNYTTPAKTYAGSLLWTVDGATVKNLIFEDAKVVAGTSVLTGRTKNYSKFINIAIEVNELTTTNASVISGPSDLGTVYENCILFAKSTPSTSIVYSGFVGGLYCQSAEFKNSYLVSDLADLPVAPSGHNKIEPTISGKHERWTLAQAEAKYTEGYDWGTELLNEAASRFFSGPVRYEINAQNVDLLQTATDGIYTLTENVDLSGKTWTPSETFTGLLDGNGYKISNLNGSLFKAVDGARICNVILDEVTNPVKGVFAAENIAKDIQIENVIVKVTEASATRIALLGYQTGGTATLKNVVVDMFNFVSNSDYKGFLTTHAGGKQILENVYCVGGNGSLHSKIGNSEQEAHQPFYYKAGGTTAAVEATDYFIGSGMTEFEASINRLDDPFKKMVNDYYFPKIQVNAQNVGVLQTATKGEYVLTEDIDLSGVTWAPTAIFTGTLNGNGFTISNLTGSLFKGISGAKIRNVILDNVTSTANGVLCADQLRADVEVNNVIVKVTEASATRIALLGYQTGGTATLKNVVVDMFNFVSNSDYKGFLTTHAGGKQILENVYCVGGNGSLHSKIGNSEQEAHQPFYYKADGTTAAVENTDYFIGSAIGDFSASIAGLDEEFKTLIDKAYPVV